MIMNTTCKIRILRLWHHEKIIVQSTKILGPHQNIYGNQFCFAQMKINFWVLEKRDSQVPLLKLQLCPTNCVGYKLLFPREKLQHTSMWIVEGSPVIFTNFDGT